MKSKYVILSANIGFVLLMGPSRALAASAPPLGSAADFAVLGGSAVTCTGSTIDGDVGVDLGGAVTQTNCTITGTVHLGDTAAQEAYDDFVSAHAALALEPCTGSLDTVYTDTALTLAPGVYCNPADVTFTRTTLTLDGDADAVWIFKIGTLGTGALTGTNFSVVMPGGDTCNNNVFWWTAEAATLTDSPFLGSILAGAAISTTDSSLDGQALAKAAVTLTRTPVCGGPASPPKCRIKVTGGGQIPVPNPSSSGRASFGFNARQDRSGDGARGHLNYRNHVTGLHVEGSVTDLDVIATNSDGSPKTVRLSGTCDRGPACSFKVTAEDRGDPGTSDQFGIVVTGKLVESRSQRVISRGKIQFHKHCDRRGKPNCDDCDSGGHHRCDRDGHHHGDGKDKDRHDCDDDDDHHGGRDDDHRGGNDDHRGGGSKNKHD